MKTIIVAAVLAVSASAAQAANTSAPAGWQRVDCATVSATAGTAAAAGTQIALRPGCYVRIMRFCGTYNRKRYCRTVRQEVCYNQAQSSLESQPSAIARASA